MQPACLRDAQNQPRRQKKRPATAAQASIIAAFGREFGLHQLALEDLYKQGQRPKLDPYGAPFHSPRAASPDRG